MYCLFFHYCRGLFSKFREDGGDLEDLGRVILDSISIWEPKLKEDFKFAGANFKGISGTNSCF